MHASQLVRPRASTSAAWARLEILKAIDEQGASCACGSETGTLLLQAQWPAVRHCGQSRTPQALSDVGRRGHPGCAPGERGARRAAPGRPCARLAGWAAGRVKGEWGIPKVRACRDRGSAGSAWEASRAAGRLGSTARRASASDSARSRPVPCATEHKNLVLALSPPHTKKRCHITGGRRCPGIQRCILLGC